MAKCAICEKGAHFGNNVSHSHRKITKDVEIKCKICSRENRKRSYKEDVCLYFLFEIRKS